MGEGDTSLPAEDPKPVVCKTCTPEGLECARLKLQINKHVTLHGAYSKIASGRSGSGPSLFQRGTTRLYNEADQAEFQGMLNQNTQRLKGLLGEYKKRGCDPVSVLEARKIVHNYKPPVSDTVFGGAKRVAGKGAKYVLKKVPLVGDLANDAIEGLRELWEQSHVP